VTFSLATDTNLINNSQTPDTVASFTIRGVGAGTFTDPFYVFDNQGVSVAGFTDANVEDIVDLSNPAFATYDVKSPIGPLDCTLFFLASGKPLGSTLGTIIFESSSGTPTFTAFQGGSTPEPSSLVLLTSGGVG
jgi:hypothetical protein